MKIGTISFEIKGRNEKKYMALDGAQRRELIASVASHEGPDLLVCAGYSLHEISDLDWLMKDERISQGKSHIVVEVQYDNCDRAHQDLSIHQLYLVVPGNSRPQPLGRQAIVQGVDRNNKNRMRRFRDSLNQKITAITLQESTTNCLALCCGEINILRRVGLTDDVVVDRDIDKYLAKADIAVNPTHDRMSNMYNVLKVKRQWLSRKVNGRRRIYISSSNWNTDLGQRKNSESLHTVYCCGKPAALERMNRDEYEYRYCDVTL